MIHHAFDDKTQPVITPELFYGKREKVCDICIVTFSIHVMEEIVKRFSCSKVAEIGSVNGSHPIYVMEYKGKKIAFYMTKICSAGTGNCLEEARCLIGARHYIIFGSCGALDREVGEGKLVVPTWAYRDEGFSYHYVPAAEYIRMKNADRVEALLHELEVPCVKGRTWSTDALYRETRGKVERLKQDGCVAVEMECAGAQAVCDFYGMELYYFLISGDLLDGEEWDARILGDAVEMDSQVRSFYIALEMALRIE